MVALLGRLDDGNLHARLDAGELRKADDLEAGSTLAQCMRERIPGDGDIAAADVGDAVADFIDIAEIGGLPGFKAVPQAASLQLALGQLADGGGIRVGEAHPAARGNEIVPGRDRSIQAGPNDHHGLHAGDIHHIADELLLFGLSNVAFVGGEEEIAGPGMFHLDEDSLRGAGMDEDALSVLGFIVPGDRFNHLAHGRGAVDIERLVNGHADPVKPTDQPREHDHRAAERDERWGEA